MLWVVFAFCSFCAPLRSLNHQPQGWGERTAACGPGVGALLHVTFGEERCELLGKNAHWRGGRQRCRGSSRRAAEPMRKRR